MVPGEWPLLHTIQKTRHLAADVLLVRDVLRSERCSIDDDSGWGVADWRLSAPFVAWWLVLLTTSWAAASQGEAGGVLF